MIHKYQKSLGVPSHVSGMITKATINTHSQIDSCGINELSIPPMINMKTVEPPPNVANTITSAKRLLKKN